jgi:hypothetical protein
LSLLDAKFIVYENAVVWVAPVVADIPIVSYLPVTGLLPHFAITRKPLFSQLRQKLGGR